MRMFPVPQRWQGTLQAPAATPPAGGPPGAPAGDPALTVQGQPPAGGPSPAPTPPPGPTGYTAPTVVEPDKPKLGEPEKAKLRQAQSQMVGLNHALDTYAKAFRDAGSAERLRSVAGLSTALQTAWANVALLVKGEPFFNLGVLNGPDLAIIRRVLADPATIAGGVISPDELEKQVALIKQQFMTGLNEWERRGGQPLTPGAAPPGGQSNGRQGGSVRDKYRGLE